MPVDERDINKGIEVLKKNGAQRAWLFGSALEAPQIARDIDFACEGIPSRRFFEVVGELLDALEKPVDLVDVDVNNRLTRYIRSKGRLLYDAR